MVLTIDSQTEVWDLQRALEQRIESLDSVYNSDLGPEAKALYAAEADRVRILLAKLEALSRTL